MRSAGIIFLLLSFLSVDLFATVPQGRGALSLYVLEEGLPVSGAELVVNDKVWAKTNELGSIRARLPLGMTKVAIRLDQQVLIEREFDVRDQESLQMILWGATKGQGFQPILESSHKLPEDKKKEDEDEKLESQGRDESAPKGTLSGTVTSLESSFPVPGAKVFFSGISNFVKTDGDGFFSAELPQGDYAVSVIHPDFSSQTVKDIIVNAKETTTKDFELTPSGMELDEFVVSAPYLEGGFTGLADEVRETSGVKDVIGADQISASGDSSAAGALKRVTGLTVLDGKFVYVRGLGERYSSTTLNGGGMSSPDPTRRVVPLDLLPAGMLGSVAIQKTYEPDMPGDFAGGVVQLRTKGIPEEKVRKISISLGGNTNSTFQEGSTYEGGGTDFLGIDDGTRDRSSRFDAITDSGAVVLSTLTDDEREEAGESLANNYDVINTTMTPDVGLKINWGNRNEAYEGDWGWGYNLAFNYSNKWRQKETEKHTYGLDVNGGLNEFDEVNETSTENDINLGGMMNLTAELGDNHVIQSTTVLTRSSTNSVIEEDAYLSENDLNVKDTTLEWVERQLFTQQFSGEHKFESLNDSKVDWQFTLANADRIQPDTRFYRYELNENNEYEFSKDGESNLRSWEDLHDESINLGLDYTYPIYDFFGGQATLKAGFYQEDKTRDSEFQRYRFETDFSNNELDESILDEESLEDILNEENIDPEGYELATLTRPTDNYTAEQSISAIYFKANADWQEWKFMAGARVEDAVQQVTTFELSNPDEKNVAELAGTDTLPALSSTWEFAEDMQLRAAFSQTVNRPDLKELSEAPYLDPETRYKVEGNPDLQRALISNFDFRWEWYLTKFETVSAAVFYKNFEQPIEKIILPGSEAKRSFANADSAVNFGLEFQARTWLSRLFGSNWSKFYLESNLTVIDSEVTLGELGTNATNDQRALQGQSPWIVNLTLGYENLVSKTKASMLFNMAGEYIDSVGTKGLPDAYAQPVPLLDLVYSRELWEGHEEKLKLKAKLKNLLDPKFEVLRGDEVERTTQKGVSFNTSLEYKWK